MISMSHKKKSISNKFLGNLQDVFKNLTKNIRVCILNLLRNLSVLVFFYFYTVLLVLFFIPLARQHEKTTPTV